MKNALFEPLVFLNNACICLYLILTFITFIILLGIFIYAFYDNAIDRFFIAAIIYFITHLSMWGLHPLPLLYPPTFCIDLDYFMHRSLFASILISLPFLLLSTQGCIYFYWHLLNLYDFLVHNHIIYLVSTHALKPIDLSVY